MQNLFTDSGTGNTVLWSPDGTALLTMTYDGLLYVWAASTGDLRYELESPHGWYKDQEQTSFSCVAWSSCGKYIAAGTRLGQIFIWDGENHQIIQVMRSHRAGVADLAWSPGGDRLASASYDGTVKVWIVGKELPVLTYCGHRQVAYALAWSPDGRYLASAGNERTVQIWYSTSARRVQTYRGHCKPVRSLAWSPDGHYLASTGEDSSLQIWHAAVGCAWWRRLGGVRTTRVTRLNGRLAMGPGEQVQWSHDGRVLAHLTLAGIQLFFSRSHTYIDSYANVFQSFSLSPDGNCIAVARASKISFWQLPRL